jgi:hypothetical protein
MLQRKSIIVTGAAQGIGKFSQSVAPSISASGGLAIAVEMDASRREVSAC